MTLLVADISTWPRTTSGGLIDFGRNIVRNRKSWEAFKLR
jgi:hypothetical protein